MTTQPLDSNGRACKVVALRSLQTGHEFHLPPEQQRWTIGSASACELSIVDDPSVSRAHCTIERRGEIIMIRDHNSRNGTLIDNNAIHVAELRVGAVVRLGRSTFIAVGGTQRRPLRAIEQLIGHAPALRTTIEQALRIAQSDYSVLIVGETGTGKDLIARLIHESSRRATNPYIAVNCGAFPRELVAAELFGHERGAFTGAQEARDGYFLQANTGTLFLDELGELPLEMQPNLLRVLENRTVRRVGGGTERPIDIRIVAATNRIDNLGTAQSSMRLDLYHRVATVVLSVPPMRERMGDLHELVESKLAEMAPDHGTRRISAASWRLLGEYRWPGNVRELLHSVERAVLIGGPELAPSDFLAGITPLANKHRDRDSELVPYEQILRGAMEHALAVNGSIRAAAAALGMPKSTFAEKAKAWGLTRPRKKR